MMKKKRTTQNKGTVSAKSAEVVTGAVSTKGGPKKTSPSMEGIEFLAVGISKKGGKFLLVAKNGKYAVLSVRNLGRDPSAELERLDALDVHLLVPHARNAFLWLAQDASEMEPTFKVATQIGWFDDLFVLPDRVYPPQPPMAGMPRAWSRILVHLDAKDEDIHSRFRCSGSSRKSRELFQLCRGNSRLIFGAAVSFVGPCCKPFDLRAPGVQFWGGPDSGKTVVAVLAGATFGGDLDSSLGFGSAWNGTPNGLEEYGPAHNDTLMVLDETSLLPTDQRGRTLAFGEGLLRLTQRQGKKRHRLSVDRWSAPLVSTSNVSVYGLLDPKRRENYAAYTDRLMDIPPPNHGRPHFEDLHGRKNDAAFGKYLFHLATHNFGYPSRVFLARLTSALARDRAGLAVVVAQNVTEYEAAAAAITSPRRSVLRVQGYFATVYAVGCLAIRFTILPFTEAELLAAILSCHRDHVAFVDNEVAGGPSWTVDAAVAQEFDLAGAARKPVARAAVVTTTPFDRLRRFINRNSEHGFIDSRLSRLPFENRLLQLNGAPVPGYIADGEYWIPGHRFKQVAGGSREAAALKKELFSRGLLEAEPRGKGFNYVVKRQLPDDSSRPYFVVVRHKPKKLGQAVASAAPV